MDESFYKKAADYWANVEPTLEGVLGGFGCISGIDLDGSRIFLDALFQHEDSPNRVVALDCGAGIGRISKDLLISYFEKVDLVEPNPKFLDVAKSTLEDKKKLGNSYIIGLQNFNPELNYYDVIWCQWVLGHLTDNDLINFFSRCAVALKKNGVIVVKENITSSGKVEKDDVDSSVTRPLILLEKIFKKAKLKVIKQHKQHNFPQGIYPVYIFALRPKDNKTVIKSIEEVNVALKANNCMVFNKSSVNIEDDIIVEPMASLQL